MKTPKLLKKTEEILSAKKSKQREQIKCLKEILSKLKKRKKKLHEKLKHEDDPREVARLERDLAIIHAQRKKGLRTLKDLK